MFRIISDTPFFFSRSGDPRDLHSFPTRRSSDPVEGASVGPALEKRDLQRSHAGRGRTRSEEHTSELQSRRDRVCRLLHEKKKKTTKGCCRWRENYRADAVGCCEEGE